MNAEQAIQAFASARHRLPADAMQWARDHWEAAAPEFLALLDRYAAGADRSQGAADALLIILHIFGEMKETRAFPAICDLAMTRAIDDVLGDGVVDSLTGILLATYDGDLGKVRRIIEAPDADEPARSAGLDMLAYLAVAGLVPRGEVETYLGELFETLEPRMDATGVWAQWAAAKLSRWYSLSPQYEEDLQKSAKAKAERQTAPAVKSGFRPVQGQLRNPNRNIGRNDPCPCGSGQKYKKCCLEERMAS